MASNWSGKYTIGLAIVDKLVRKLKGIEQGGKSLFSFEQHWCVLFLLFHIFSIYSWEACVKLVYSSISYAVCWFLICLFNAFIHCGNTVEWAVVVLWCLAADNLVTAKEMDFEHVFVRFCCIYILILIVCFFFNFLKLLMILFH